MRILGSYALVYILRGPGRYADSRGVNQKLSTGDLIFVYPEIAHSYGPQPDRTWDEIYIVFDGPVFDVWRARGLLDDTRPVSRLEPVDYWFRRIESVAGSDHAEPPLTTICRLQALLAEIRQCQHNSGHTDADREWVSNAKRLLKEDVPWQEFDLAAIADRMAISYVGFRKKFVRLSGISPGKYRTKAVMDRACTMIRNEACSNRALALKLGFCDEFHFSRRFKQLVGLSPAQFRRQLAKGANAGNER